jgi:uncharacterized protein Yka (UPF0111/DUF47 family)
MRGLYNRALQPDFTFQQVNAVAEEMRQQRNCTLKILQDVAQTMGFFQKFKKKDDAINAMANKIKERRELENRTDHLKQGEPHRMHGTPGDSEYQPS